MLAQAAAVYTIAAKEDFYLFSEKIKDFVPCKSL
jgi:hypothetical protein